jgi:integrase
MVLTGVHTRCITTPQFEKPKKAKMTEIPILGSRKIQSRLKQTKLGRYQFRLKFRPRGIDKLISSKADNKEDAAQDIIDAIQKLNEPQEQLSKVAEPVKSGNLHTWAEIFTILDDKSDNGDKQISSAKTATRRILRGIGDTEDNYPHQATKDRIDRWFESQVKRGKNVDDKLAIKKKLNKSIGQMRYGVFKKTMMKYYNLGPSFDINTIKILKFKPVKYRRPTDDRHERADKHFREVVKFADPLVFGFYQVMRISAQRNVEVAYLKRDNLLPDCILNDRIVPRKNETEREIPYPDGFTEDDRQFLLGLNPDGEYVLPGTDWDRQHGYSKKLNELLRPFGFTAYQLRKEWACQLLDQKVPVHIVAEMMGNTVQVLLDYYVAVKKTKFSLKLG